MGIRAEQEESQREETEEREEAKRETTLVLPDAVVDSFRTDLDLPKAGEDQKRDEDDPPDGQRPDAERLANDFSDRIARGGYAIFAAHIHWNTRSILPRLPAPSLETL